MSHILQRSAQSVRQFVISTKATSKRGDRGPTGARSPKEGAPFSWYKGAPSLQSDLWRPNTDVRSEHCTITHMGCNQGLSPDSDPLLTKHVWWLGIGGGACCLEAICPHATSSLYCSFLIHPPKETPFSNLSRGILV